MKVLHIATGFPVSFAGGITNYVRTLVRSQMDKGYEVHVLARPDSHPTIPACKVHTYSPSMVVAFSVKNTESDPSTEQIYSLLKKECFDLVHFHMALDLPLCFLETFRELGLAYVVSLHDYFYLCPRIYMVDVQENVCRELVLSKCRNCVGKLDQVDFLRLAARKLNLCLPRIPSTATERRMEAMRSFLEGADVLLAVSRRTAAIYGHAVPNAKVVVEQIGSVAATLAPAPKVPSPKIRVTALSNLSKIKGASVLEEIMRRVHRPDMEFHFYGRSFEGYENRLHALGMRFHGAYSPKDVSTIMSNTDLGLVLSIWEDNGPQVTMEFVSNKIPVLGTLRGGIPDIVPDGAGFLFDPAVPEEIARAAAWLQSLEYETIESMTSRMCPLKTPDQHADAIDKIYREVTAR